MSSPRNRERRTRPDAPTAAAGTPAKDALDLEQAHRRLEQLYEISKRFARFENVEQTFHPALDLAAAALPLRSAILFQVEDGRPKMIVWPSESQDAERMRAVKAHVEEAFAYLVGAAATGPRDRGESGAREPSRQAQPEGRLERDLVVIPLVVAHHPPFGVLQLEGAGALDKEDLIFVNAIANQLAIALDRDRAWRRDITRREHAEEGRSHAEARSTTAERERTTAESMREKFEAVAVQNAMLYQQAQHAVRVRERILAIVSHDLQNPLWMIVMTIEALAQGIAPKERRVELPRAMGRIKRAAEGMQRLIEDLLDFASIEAESLAIKRKPQDPGAMIHETLASFEAIAQAKSLRLTAKVDPGLPVICCDRDRILQVLSNLVANATKITAEGGLITLRLEARGSELLFAVADDGPGIGEEELRHLFERYWRGGEATYAGTGLGLAIARGIVSAHGGRIWAVSELGRGATFHFTLPVADGAGARP